MNKKVIVSILLLVIICTAEHVDGARKKLSKKKLAFCKRQLVRMDRCVRKIVWIGDPEIESIKNQTQFDNHCNALRRQERCVLRYKKCLSVFAGEIFNIIQMNADKLLKNRCVEPEGIKAFKHAASCVRKPEVFEANECVDKAVVLLNYAATNASDDELFPSACCAVQLGKQCIRKVVDKVCIGYIEEGEKVSGYVEYVIDSLLGDVVDLLCGPFNSIESCEEGKPGLMAAFRPLISDKTPPQKTSIAIPLLKIADRIDYD